MGRERYVDLLRAVAITAVVLGHWLVTVIERGPDGTLTGRSALPDLRWAQPLTWLVQVLPIFFLVGGYANAASLSSRYRRGGSAAGWLRDRSDRLVRPTTVLILVVTAGAILAGLLGATPTQVRTAAWFATVPLWFLAAYLAVVVLTPVMYALHQRFGLAVPLVLVALVTVGDLARFHGPAMVATGSFLFGWLVMHQIGFVWRDRSVSRSPLGRRVSLTLLVGGSAALLALTVAGPYPVSMINLPGERLQNMSPPSLALLALATAQFGLIMLLREPAERWLREHRPWLVVVAVNSVVLTVFLWHVTAAILLAGGLDRIGRLPTAPAETAAWWLGRLPWLALLTLVLAGLVAVFGRFEWRPGRSTTGWLSRPTARWPRRGPGGTLLVVAGYAAVICGLLVNSSAPRETAEPFGIPVAALVAYLAGAALLRTLRPE